MIIHSSLHVLAGKILLKAARSNHVTGLHCDFIKHDHWSSCKSLKVFNMLSYDPVRLCHHVLQLPLRASRIID